MNKDNRYSKEPKEVSNKWENLEVKKRVELYEKLGILDPTNHKDNLWLFQTNTEFREETERNAQQSINGATLPIMEMKKNPAKCILYLQSENETVKKYAQNISKDYYE